MENHYGPASNEQPNQILNRKQDLFLATLSHELRTPLTAILTWAQMISNGKMSSSQAQQAAAIIEQNALLQSRLIDDLLDVSRMMLGKLTLNLNTINPLLPIQFAIDSLLPIAKEKSIQLELHADQISVFMRGDAVRIQQMMWNLINNAIKFSPKNSKVVVKVEIIHKNDQDLLQIEIVDEGHGIAAEYFPTIFSRFSQFDNATTRLNGGLGLGLSIVKCLTELHNGSVTAANNLNTEGQITGAIFTVLLPIEKLETPAKTNDILLTNIKILYVEDDDCTREAITFYLQAMGAQVFPINNAAEAYAQLPYFKPDVIISDLSMPNEDGYTLMKKIRLLPPQMGGRTPALALSAYASQEEMQHSYECGFQAHLAKPAQSSQLGQAILRLTQNYCTTATS